MRRRRRRRRKKNEEKKKPVTNARHAALTATMQESSALVVEVRLASELGKPCSFSCLQATTIFCLL
jgi:hypothetical protein